MADTVKYVNKPGRTHFERVDQAPVDDPTKVKATVHTAEIPEAERPTCRNPGADRPERRLTDGPVACSGSARAARRSTPP